MDNLHFIPNNIFTNFFKELTNYKNDYQQFFFFFFLRNDYQQYFNYTHKNYIMRLILYL